ncbi:DnaB-like helicase N-terminal domain-containing protein [Bacillus licheniformis]|nr:DnaB-like helicase N-terminal domain-containing protein [Bacillus licheniformis]
MEEVGGISYLTDIANSVPTAANIEYYAKSWKKIDSPPLDPYSNDDCPRRIYKGG